MACNDSTRSVVTHTIDWPAAARAAQAAAAAA
ncbi:heme-binding protein, partial [Burkholderia sp. Ac-20392]|nr:heme-binding protein [Burkholderia sp. Ac-20392]